MENANVYLFHHFLTFDIATLTTQYFEIQFHGLHNVGALVFLIGPADLCRLHIVNCIFQVVRQNHQSSDIVFRKSVYVTKV